MTVLKLLELHDQFTSDRPASLGDLLGDGFLIQKNGIYRQIRRKVLNEKVNFSKITDDLFLSFPLGQLNTILSKKQIPYIPNVPALRGLVAQLKSNLEWNEIVDGLKKNFVFHESCHLVARSLLGAPSDAPNGVRKQNVIVQLLLEESFANTCEALAIKDVTDAAHRCFYEVSSYSTLIEDRSHIQRAFLDYKPENFFLFMLLCFLSSNFLVSQMTEKELKRICILSGLEVAFVKNLKTLKSLSRLSFTLDERFKNITTGLHFKLLGYQEPLSQLLDFDYLAVMESNTELQDKLKALAKLVTATD
jgi:hypothetical protein